MILRLLIIGEKPLSDSGKIISSQNIFQKINKSIDYYFLFIFFRIKSIRSLFYISSLLIIYYIQLIMVKVNVYSRKEVSAHCTEQDCWLIIHNQVLLYSKNYI